jgi:alpha-methylacyl-CoA racemase
MEGREVCFAPVLNIDEAVSHPHMLQRKSFLEVDGVLQPAPAPRFSRTPSSVRSGPPIPGSNTKEIMSAWGFSDAEIADLQNNGAIS